jgi:RNA polymerase sigma-70 factor (ECF subfamily)
MRLLMAYLEGVGITPSQPVESSQPARISVLPGAIDPALLEELWLQSNPGACGLTRDEFTGILLRIGTAHGYGSDPELAAGEIPSRLQQAAFFRSLKLDDLVLAQACATGNERAWEHFVELYQQTLLRAAIAITGSASLGSDLANQLYAELYGLKVRDGERRCPLESYRGRGSLIGWLRTTLAQRHVDHYRRTHREQPLEDFDGPAEFGVPAVDPPPEKPGGEITALAKAIEAALGLRQPDERFLLAAYYLDERTLLQIAQVLHVHEATISRKLHRIVDDLRKQILKTLESSGLSRRAAEEALQADPRDLDINLKKLLQSSQPDAFQEKAAL